MNERKYREFNTPRRIKYKDPMGFIKEAWIYKGLLRSEAWMKRYIKQQEYEKRVREKRKHE